MAKNRRGVSSAPTSSSQDVGEAVAGGRAGPPPPVAEPEPEPSAARRRRSRLCPPGGGRTLTRNARVLAQVASAACLSFALLLLLLLSSSQGGEETHPDAAGNVPGTALRLTAIQTQVVLRHGDRTPITPLADAAYWSALLPSDEAIAELGRHTRILRAPPGRFTSTGTGTTPHPAGGDDVFGRLTADGISQMISLGITLRRDVERLLRTEDCGIGMGALGQVDPSLWLTVASTDFGRTVQSAQGVVLGLLRGREGEGMLRGRAAVAGGATAVRVVTAPRAAEALASPPVVEIDARHTDRMIPDPRPRRYVGQAELERRLMAGEEFARREAGMTSLAVRVTRALYEAGMLGDAASRVRFGVGEDEAAAGGGGGGGGDSRNNAPGTTESSTEPLPWNQLAEILKCLERRGRLPQSITPKDVEDVAEHNAWRWFALLGDDRLGPMAIKSLAKKMILNGAEAVDSSASESGDNVGGRIRSSPLMHIFSGHDATLIALMCAFNIERPAVWPEYGSYLKMELLRDDAGLCGRSTSGGFDGCSLDDAAKGERSGKLYYVLFSLNGEALRSAFGASADRSAGGTRAARSRYFVPWDDVLEGLDTLENGLPPLLAAS